METFKKTWKEIEVDLIPLIKDISFEEVDEAVLTLCKIQGITDVTGINDLYSRWFIKTSKKQQIAETLYQVYDRETIEKILDSDSAPTYRVTYN